MNTEIQHKTATTLTQAKRLIVKVGSSLLMQGKDGSLNTAWMATLGEDLAAARARDQDVILVSSGAIALGRGCLGLSDAPLSLEQSQAAAAAGQISLAHAWQEALSPQGITIAQILLTLEDTEQRRRYLNARSTLNALLDLGAVPVINENDTVATQEIRYGDNDRLAARVTSMVSGDCLVLLSDIDGLYSDADRIGDAKAHISAIPDITQDVLAMAGENAGHFGSGGMKTKLEAARIATDAGASMILASGREAHPIRNILDGKGKSTLFGTKASPRTARKDWIAASLQLGGYVHIDLGAVNALQDGKSLLPIGIKSISGDFDRGDCVAILGPDCVEMARGLVEHSSETGLKIMGKQTTEIVNELSYDGRTEMVHRDNLVMTQNRGGEDDA